MDTLKTMNQYFQLRLGRYRRPSVANPRLEALHQPKDKTPTHPMRQGVTTGHGQEELSD